MESIVVKDNGSGIDEKYFEGVALRHYTSKIKDLSSLEELTTYGFRGEAISSLCNLCGEVKISTRTANAQKGTKLSFNRNGAIISKEPCNHPVGTTIEVLNLFQHFPVRKQVNFLKVFELFSSYFILFLKALQQKLNEQVNKVLLLLQAYCLIHPEISWTLERPPRVGLTKKSTDTKGAISELFSPLTFEGLQVITKKETDSIVGPFVMEIYLPKKSGFLFFFFFLKKELIF